MTQFTDTHREVLTALCDTVVPGRASETTDPDGFFARRASDVGVPQAHRGSRSARCPTSSERAARAAGCARRAGLPARLSALAGADPAQHRAHRPAAAAGVGALVTLTLFLVLRRSPTSEGRTRTGRRSAIPAPPARRRRWRRSSMPLTPDGDTTLEADVCIVGSGAGGGVMAGVLGERGLKVVVLEAGGYFDDADFLQLEVPAYQNTYWRGGPHAHGRHERVAAWRARAWAAAPRSTGPTRCAPRPWVRDQWEREYGLEGRRRVGLRRSPGRGAGTRSGRERPLLGPQPPPAADEGEARRTGLELHARPAATSDRGSATRSRPPATSASATRPAPSSRRRRPT